MSKKPDPYASGEDTLALIRKDTRTPAERELDRMLEDRGASEQGAEPTLIMRQIALELLAEQPAQQEPVSDKDFELNWMNYQKGFSAGVLAGIEQMKQALTQPAQRKPMTDEWINDCVREAGETTEPDSDFGCFEWLVRKVEAAHGIKGDA